MKNDFYLSLKYFFKNKRMFISFIIIGLILTLTIIITCYNSSAKNYYEKGYLYQFRAFNDLRVEPQYGVEYPTEKQIEAERSKIQSIDHITGVYRLYTGFIHLTVLDFQKEGNDGFITLYAANDKTLPELVKGEVFPDNDGYYLVCPDNFYPTQIELDKNIITEKNRIDFTDKVGKNIEISYKNSSGKKTNKMSLKLTGIYKNDDYVMDEYTCYTTEKVIDELYFNQYDNREKDLSYTEYKSYYVHVDKLENVDKVKKELEKKGYHVEKVGEVETSYFDEIEKETMFWLVIVYIIAIIFLIIMLTKQFNHDEKYYKLLYCLGYQKKDITIINFVSSILRLLISLLIAFIGTGISILIINKQVQVKPFLFNKWDIVIDYKPLLILLGIIVFICIISTIISVNSIHESEGEVI